MDPQRPPMNDDLSTEPTSVIANYASRVDAEVAKSLLEDRGIDSVIVADDTHTVVQMTEGSRLLVLSREADAARAALEEANLDDAANDLSREEGAAEPERWTDGISLSTYVGTFLLVVALIALTVAVF